MANVKWQKRRSHLALLPFAFCHLPFFYFASSYPAKKYATSNRAVSSASEPCTAFASMLAAYFFRIVPSSALAGLVAPISLRHDAIASSSFSRHMATHGPLDIKLVSDSKNG